MVTLSEQLIEQFNKMDEVQKQRLLNFARILTKTPAIRGEPGASVFFTGFGSDREYQHRAVEDKVVLNLLQGTFCGDNERVAWTSRMKSGQAADASRKLGDLFCFTRTQSH